MKNIGEFLKQQRIFKGLSLNEVSISWTFQKAICVILKEIEINRLSGDILFKLGMPEIIYGIFSNKREINGDNKTKFMLDKIISDACVISEIMGFNPGMDSDFCISSKKISNIKVKEDIADYAPILNRCLQPIDIIV